MCPLGRTFFEGPEVAFPSLEVGAIPKLLGGLRVRQVGPSLKAPRWPSPPEKLDRFDPFRPDLLRNFGALPPPFELQANGLYERRHATGACACERRALHRAS